MTPTWILTCRATYREVYEVDAPDREAAITAFLHGDVTDPVVLEAIDSEIVDVDDGGEA